MSAKPVANRTVDILLVEDNPADIRLTQEALKETNIINELHLARDGEQAMAFLHRLGEHKDAKRPDLILLDINMPRKNGLEVLAEIKTDKNFRSIPVVMLTTSAADEDILQAYSEHANTYVRKPMELDDFFEVVKGIEEFWLGLAQLPPPKAI